MVSLALMAVAVPAVYSEQREAKAPVDVLEMKSVPDGHYLVNLQQGDNERLVNLQIKGDAAKAVNSSDPNLKGLEGKFQSVGNGVFMITLRNGKHTATQFWVFRKDGSAAVKETPDRGEKQTAIPVRDESLERSE